MAGSEIRSLGELSTQARGYFTAAIGGAAASVWPNSFTVTAKVLALLGHEHDRRRAWLHDQIFRSTADAAALERHAFEDGLVRRSARPARGTVTIAAGAGTEAPPRLRFLRADGAVYTAALGAIEDAGVVTLAVEADEPGAGGDLPAGATLALSLDVASPEGLGPIATVAAGGLTGGADEEDIEALRARALDHRRAPPAGGGAGDYIRWTREALPAARAVFVEPFVNEGRAVWLQFTVTDQPDGVPTGGQVNAVQTYLSDPQRKPLTARIFVSAPTPVPVDIEIADLAPDTTAIRSAIEAELAAQFMDRAEPGRPSGPFRLKRSMITRAIGRVVDEDGFDLVQPPASLDFDVGEMPVLGTVSFV